MQYLFLLEVPSTTRMNKCTNDKESIKNAFFLHTTIEHKIRKIAKFQLKKPCNIINDMLCCLISVGFVLSDTM